MWGRKLWVVMSRGNGRDIVPHLAEHLDYLIALEAEGKIFASGPMNVPGSGDGMTILRVETEEEARAIANADPLVTKVGRDLQLASLDRERGANHRDSVVLANGTEPQLMSGDAP